MTDVADIADFAQQVKSQRKTRGLSQKELANCIGCSIKTIEKIESGDRRPSMQIAELMADCLGLLDDRRARFLMLAREPLGTATPHNTPNNLPAPATAFIGREKEVADGIRLLRNPEVHLLTFSGPPGIGKTRLSLRIASRALPLFPDGVYFVALATVRDPGMIISAIVRTLKLSSDNRRSETELLQEYFRDKRILLILDNFEQLVSGGPSVGALLSEAPGLKVVTSSRELLHLYGEYEFPVPPMSLPDISNLPPPEEMTQYEAIKLFVRRGEAAKQGFHINEGNASHIAAICARLDGLALAIELAAARVRQHSPDQILRRLKPGLDLLVGGPQDLPARQQTLRAAIAWSYDLLSEKEQIVFRSLAVFAEATTQAVSAVSGWGGEHPIDGTLSSLVGKSLLRREESKNNEVRYWMLETIRDYAVEKLDENNERVEIETKHALYYLQLARNGEREIRGPESAKWLANLEAEHDNMRLAMRRAIQGGDGVTALRLASALRWFWYLRGYVAEGRRWLEEALSVGKEPTPERAEALNGLGVLAERLGDYEGAKTALTESIELWRSLGDMTGTARALHNMAGVALEHSEYDRAEQLYYESLELWRKLGDVQNTGPTLHNLSMIVYERGDYDRALEMCMEALPIFEAAGNMVFAGRTLTAVGEILRLKGNYEEASQYYNRSLAFAGKQGDRKGQSLVLVNLGYVERRIGKLDQAETYTREALKLDIEARDSANVALDLVAMAGLAASLQQPEKAARLFSAADRLLNELAVAMSAIDQLEYERDLAEAKAQLSQAAWDELTIQGRAMSADEAVNYALS